MRRKLNTKRVVQADLEYNSENLGKLINYVMKAGKKDTARRVISNTMKIIKEKAKVDNPIEIFDAAVKNTSPLMEVRSRRVGGANYQVPREVRPERKLALSLRWIVEAARGKKGAEMEKKLADELIAAAKNEGEAVKKRENVHKMADANKAFAHFTW